MVTNDWAGLGDKKGEQAESDTGSTAFALPGFTVLSQKVPTRTVILEVVAVTETTLEQICLGGGYDVKCMIEL